MTCHKLFRPMWSPDTSTHPSPSADILMMAKDQRNLLPDRTISELKKLSSHILGSTDAVYARQSSTMCSTNESIPRNHTFSHRRAFVFTWPWCPSCAKYTTRLWRIVGIMILLPFISRPSSSWLTSSTGANTNTYIVWTKQDNMTTTGHPFYTLMLALCSSTLYCFCEVLQFLNFVSSSSPNIIWTHNQTMNWF